MSAEKVEPLALMACKAVMRARVSAAAKAAFAVLIDHHNWRSGRCDPGLSRIAKLSGYSRDAVQTGIKQLAETGFIQVMTHGGGSDRNQYIFDWQHIRSLDSDAKVAMGWGVNNPRGRGENAHGGGGENAPQTRLIQPEEEPVSLSHCSDGERFQCREGQAKGSKPDWQYHMPYVVPGGKGTDRSDAAGNAAERRRVAAIQKLPKDQQAAAWLSAMDEVPTETTKPVRRSKRMSSAEVNIESLGRLLTAERRRPAAIQSLPEDQQEEAWLAANGQGTDRANETCPALKANE